jgi:chemotaxis signal transduction protein
MKSVRLATDRFRSGKDASGSSYLLCRVQSGNFAIPVERVSEVVVPQRLTELPEPRPHVLGAFDHRGAVVPVVDLGSAIGRPAEEPGKPKWVLLSTPQGVVGARVSQVIDVVWVFENELRPPTTLSEVGQLTTGTVVMIRGTMAFVMAVDGVVKLAYPESR